MSHQQAEIGETLPKAFFCVCVCVLLRRGHATKEESISPFPSPLLLIASFNYSCTLKQKLSNINDAFNKAVVIYLKKSYMTFFKVWITSQ